MKLVGQFQLHIERFVRWHALLGAFDAAVAMAALWNAWQWRDRAELPMMAGLSLGMFLIVLAAQYPYWKIVPFTLLHGAQGWTLVQRSRQSRLAQVRGLSLPGQLLVLGLSDHGRVVLPISSDIPPTAWRELRTRLAM